MLCNKIRNLVVVIWLGAALAAAQTTSATNPKPKMTRGKNAWTMTVNRSAFPNTPATGTEANLVTIFSNLAADYPNGLYWCCMGYNVMGPNSGAGVQWMAATFTPTANHTLTKIDVGAGFSQGATNGVVLTLNLDKKGKPGKVLKTWNISGLSRFGTCCAVAEASDDAGIPVNAGHAYWIVLKTDNTELDTVDGWNVDDTDQVNMATMASYSGTKWTVFQASPGLAFAVLGSN